MPNLPLQPKYILTVGTQQWSEQLVGLWLQLTLGPGIDLLEVQFPIRAPVEAAPGDAVALSLANGDTEDAAEETIFSGQVSALRRDFRFIRLRAVNSGGILARARLAATFEQISAGNLVRNLCDEVGVSAGQVDDGPMLTAYAASPDSSAWDHVARVAAWGGAATTVSPDDRVETRVINAAEAEIALRYGREILAMTAEELAAPLKSFTVTGEAGAGDASSPDAARYTSDFFAGNRPDGPGPAQRWRSEPDLRTVPSAGVAGAALQRHYQSSRNRGRIEAFLQPVLRPGSVIQVQELPAHLPGGPLWLHRVDHRLTRRGATTRADFYQGGDSFDPLALLGSLAGALGGLL